ncbi:SRPBCC family protein [soil metagenome]
MHQLQKGKSLTDILTNTKINISQTERIVSGIAGSGLVAYGLKRRDTFGVTLTVIGALLGLRGATGHCQIYDAAEFSTAESGETRPTRIHVQKSVTINKSQSELYIFWRNFENLPQFMNHLEYVKTTGEKTSHWRAKAPLGYSVEWDAELTSDVENEKIGWKSAEISEVPNSGTVEFLPTRNRGTEVRVTLTYEPPAGKIGSLVAKLFGEEPSQQVAEDLRRFKRLMETGLIMKIEGQPSGREALPKTIPASA